MRYAETRGHEFDYLIPNAWQYRDYVIRALNADVPYNQFVTEHIAGDLLESPRRHPTEEFNESILATGFWFLNEWVHSPVDIRKDEADRFDNAIDVYSKTFLGMTVACARCHDHKFDAISQADYYALVGFLQSSDYRQVRFETMEHNQAIAEALDQLRDAYGQQVAQHFADGIQRTDAATLAALVTEHGLPKPQLDHTPWQTLMGSADYHVIADFSQPNAAWQSDGPLFSHLHYGQLILDASADATAFSLVKDGRLELEQDRDVLQHHELAEVHQRQRNRTVDPGKRLRLPAFQLTKGKLFYLIRGAAQIHAVVDSHRLIDGPLHGATFQTVEASDELRWIEQDLTRYVGHGVLVELSASGNEQFSVLCVVEGPSPPPLPQAKMSAFPYLVATASPNALSLSACSTTSLTIRRN